MNTSYLTCGVLIFATIIKATDGWTEGQKWRERRIAHVFGKRNGDTSNSAFPPFSFAQNDRYGILDDEDNSSEDYDQSYPTEPDRIPQSVINRLAYLDLIRTLIRSNSDSPSYWDDLKSYLDYPQEH